MFFIMQIIFDCKVFDEDIIRFKPYEMKYVYTTIILAVLIAYGIYHNSININFEETSCIIVKQTNYCRYIHEHCNPQYFNIATAYYCSKYYPSYIVAICMCVVILAGLVLLLISLSLLVSNYLFPNLNSIAHLLHINDKILSFVLIPMTNAFPDFINYYIALHSNSIDLMLGQLIGSVLIIVTIIIGLISFLHPFKVVRSKWVFTNFMWILAVLVLLLYVLSDGVITLFECIVMIGFYFCYVCYLIIWGERQVEVQEDCISMCSGESIKSINHTVNIEDAMDIISQEEPSLSHIDEEIERNEHEHWITSIPKHIFGYIDFLFSFVIPVGDVESSDSKAYDLWYCFVVTSLVNFQFFHLHTIDLIPILLVNILAVEGLKPFLKKVPTVYQISVNVIGITMSLIIISQISKQILKIFKNLGLIMKISDYLLGLFVFSISNSINDIITNITISTTINPMFGINACLGTPLLIVLLGIGVNGLILNLNNQNLNFELNANLAVSLLGLIAVILFYLVYIPLNDWKLDKKLGVVVICWWCIITLTDFYLE